MEAVKSVYTYIIVNQVALVGAIGAALVFAEFITRLTPTKTDDGFVSRVGKVFKTVFDFLKIPNNIKGETPKEEDK